MIWEKTKAIRKRVKRIRGSCSRITRGGRFDATTWTPVLVQQYLDESYAVEYSIPSCRQLLEKRD
ncbi:hypothetical protein CP556_17870 [Natrinema sp. CBA1119]|nr:hypothetical protein CP556_17870 [Natrinema sp. CBA1119]